MLLVTDLLAEGLKLAFGVGSFSKGLVAVRKFLSTRVMAFLLPQIISCIQILQSKVEREVSSRYFSSIRWWPSVTSAVLPTFVATCGIAVSGKFDE